MSEHELEQLLGGFAAGTLTADEQQRLYAAALQDQRLFDALADEQGLKELLTDPAVRRRLLETLRQSVAKTAEPSAPWWTWFGKPARLALAGGLAAAVLALTFGTHIFQESLERNARSVATEEPVSSSPASPSLPQASPPPPAAAPATNAKESRGAGIPRAKQEATREAPAKRQLADSAKQAPAAQSLRATEDTRLSEDSTRMAAAPAPAAPAVAPMPRPAPSALSATATRASATSARARYYGNASSPTDAAAGARDKAAAAGSAQLLGVRYSFATRRSDGQNQEVSAAIAARSREPVRLVVETSVDGYLQLLQNLGSAGTRLWWPPQETGKISLKAAARTRVEIPMPPPAESGLLDLVLRFSPKPFGPLTMQEVGMLDRFSGNLLIETVTPDGATGAQESATYVVQSDASPVTQLAVDIPLSP